MSAKSDILETEIINHYFGGSGAPQPTQWWLAIYSSDPTDAITATVPTAITTRLEIDGWTRNANEAVNTNNLQFPPVPTGQTWTVTHFAIFNAITGGKPLYHSPFRIAKTLQEGDILFIAAGQLAIRET
ncbi:hypothetical protein OsccyDRAFT_0701 [Leptolyngbyaceae cyanobacterium JSC-12]|nr:hypothetical protein OsccyDRAFT_0701 [Leptolyngbyaceae cyanobacterium JSC-12]